MKDLTLSLILLPCQPTGTCRLGSVQNKLQMESGVEVEQADGEDSSTGSGGAPYSLRVRRKLVNSILQLNESEFNLSSAISFSR